MELVNLMKNQNKTKITEIFKMLKNFVKVKIFKKFVTIAMKLQLNSKSFIIGMLSDQLINVNSSQNAPRSKNSCNSIKESKNSTQFGFLKTGTYLF